MDCDITHYTCAVILHIHCAVLKSLTKLIDLLRNTFINKLFDIFKVKFVHMIIEF